MALPNCISCAWDEFYHPCRRTDGNFDFAFVAAGIVRHGRAFTDGMPDEHQVAGTSWAFFCGMEIVDSHPEHGLALIVAVMDACETLDDVGIVSAGITEDFVVKQGASHIGAIEKLANASPKFRYILSGIWSQGGSVDNDVWSRIGVLLAKGGVMNHDPRCAHAGQAVGVLEDDAALSLLGQSVSEVARDLRLIA